MTTNKDQAWKTLIAGVKEAAERGMNGEPVAAYSLSRYEEVTGGPVSVKLNSFWERVRKRLTKESDMATAAERIFTAYRDKGKKWRWRCQARNGRVVGTSGESFHDRYNAIRAATKEASYYGAVAVVKVD